MAQQRRVALPTTHTGPQLPALFSESEQGLAHEVARVLEFGDLNCSCGFMRFQMNYTHM